MEAIPLPAFFIGSLLKEKLRWLISRPGMFRKKLLRLASIKYLAHQSGLG